MRRDTVRIRHRGERDRRSRNARKHRRVDNVNTAETRRPAERVGFQIARMLAHRKRPAAMEAAARRADARERNERHEIDVACNPRNAATCPCERRIALQWIGGHEREP